MLKVDIGCGINRHEDCDVGLDKHDFSEFYAQKDLDWHGFIQHDILERLPFDDCSVDWIYCHHVFEHIPHRIKVGEFILRSKDGITTEGHLAYEREMDALIFVINEFQRVLKPGCEAFIVVPWKEHTNAWRHPTHYRFFNYDFFHWFSHKNPTPDHEAEGLRGKWEIIENRIQDECHVLAILRKVE